MEWDLHLDNARQAIAQYNAKKVLIQLPDGLKMHAGYIVDSLRDCGAELFIWTDSNYGSCDLPIEAKNLGVDLVLHYGHEAWNYSKPHSPKKSDSDSA
jgi:diphthamide biosynthesis enzyme Dph1/Dph2-like protein